MASRTLSKGGPIRGQQPLWGWANNNSNRADILTSITYPQGGSSTIAYKAAADYLNGSSGPANVAPYPVYVVSKVTTNDGFGNLASSTYQYSGGTYYYDSPIDHQLAGFSVVTETDPAGNVTKTYYDTGNGNSTSTGQYQDNFWKIGKPYRVENYDSTGDLYKVVVNKWTSASLGGNAAFVSLATTTEMDYDGLVTHNDKATSYTYNNANGNETQQVQWGQVTASNEGHSRTRGAMST